MKTYFATIEQFDLFGNSSDLWNGYTTGLPTEGKPFITTMTEGLGCDSTLPIERIYRIKYVLGRMYADVTSVDGTRYRIVVYPPEKK